MTLSFLPSIVLNGRKVIDIFGNIGSPALNLNSCLHWQFLFSLSHYIFLFVLISHDLYNLNLHFWFLLPQWCKKANSIGSMQKIQILGTFLCKKINHREIQQLLLKSITFLYKTTKCVTETIGNQLEKKHVWCVNLIRWVS